MSSYVNNEYEKGDKSKHAIENEYTVSMITNTDGKPNFEDKTITLREFSGETDLINELRFQSHNFKKASTETVHYRYGRLMISMSLSNFYLKVDGIIINTGVDNDLNDIKNKWPDIAEGYAFKKDYGNMKDVIGSSFLENVKRWMNGKNDEIITTPENFIEHAYNAQCGAAMFLAESIRNFHNHFTNMICVQMIDANIMSMEHFIHADINPMARRSSWLADHGAGTEYMNKLKNDHSIITGKAAARNYEEIKIRISRICKTSIAHVEDNENSGSREHPPEFPQLLLFQIKNNNGYRKYEQNIPDKLLFIEITEPLIQSIDTQSKEFSRTEDVSAPLQASMALAYDHAYISKEIADDMSESMKVIVEEGKETFIVLSTKNRENPSENKIIKVPIDESKLSSKEMIDNLQNQADAVKNLPSEESITTNRINKGLAIHGVVTGFSGAINKLEEGEYVEGSIYPAQSFHGLGDLTGINNKIWRSS